MKVKPAVIGLILLGMYLLSVFAVAIPTIFRSKNPGLPDKNIMTYKMSPYLRYSLIQNGITFVSYEYNPTCSECIDNLSYLEKLVTDFNKVLGKDPPIYSIYLEEISNKTFDTPVLKIESGLGNKTYTKFDENETFSSLCNLTYYPPVMCVNIS